MERAHPSAGFLLLVSRKALSHIVFFAAFFPFLSRPSKARPCARRPAPYFPSGSHVLVRRANDRTGPPLLRSSRTSQSRAACSACQRCSCSSLCVFFSPVFFRLLCYGSAGLQTDLLGRQSRTVSSLSPRPTPSSMYLQESAGLARLAGPGSSATTSLRRTTP